MWNQLLKFVPPSVAHDWAPEFLHLVSLFQSDATTAIDNQFHWRGLTFKSRFGTAGGVDKTGEQIFPWQKLGAGFVEIGTITPRPQKPNRGVILARNIQEKALWNKMGFPNDGAIEVAHLLESKWREKSIPWFLNVGKNRDTPNALAANDYVAAILALKKYTDAFVINISSPNTKHLRDLLQLDSLRSFLSPIAEACKDAKIPYLLKLTPDATQIELKNSLETAAECNCAGFILTNTTLSRPLSGWPKSHEGGLSGAPLKSLAIDALKNSRAHFANEASKFLWISVGGVISPIDAIERLALGADLVQTYSGLIYTGPQFFKEAAQMQLKVQHDSHSNKY